MISPARKFVAVLLAVWLPLFSGNALAVSMVMQTKGGDCDVMQQVSPPSQHVPDLHMHMHMNHVQPVADEPHSAGQHDSQGSSCNNCGVCHIACSGYLAAVTVEVAGIQLTTQAYTPSSIQFQSHTSAPLDPPPLALA